MDIDKSLYMTDFMKMRETLGTISLYPAKNTLFTNLYDELRPKKQVTEVVEVIEDIQEKIIHLVKKEDQPMLFPNLPDVDIGGLALDDIKEDDITEDDIKEDDIKEDDITEETKVVKLSNDMSMKGGVANLKTISIQSDYMPSD